jgi:hypothetical protein
MQIDVAEIAHGDMVTANHRVVARARVFDSDGALALLFIPMDRSTKRGGAVLGAVLVMVLALAGSAQADHASEMKARESFAAGRYDEALQTFAKLYAETLNPIYLRNIGRCQQKLKQPDKAIDAFHDYLIKGGKKISADEKAEINGYIKEMEALRDEQASKQQATPAAVVPVAPVQPIQPAQPEGPPPGYTAQPAGAYPGSQGAPGYQPGADQQQQAGALVAQPVQPEPASSGPVYTKWWFWTIIGAVVIGGVVTAVALSSGGTSKPPCTALICE